PAGQPTGGGAGPTTREQVQLDIAFRVIADHIRTLGFAVADGIQPGNTDRNYVLRRILRRAVRYGRTLGFKEPFFYKLVDVLARTMGDVFPEIRAKQQHVKDVLKLEEETFNKTLDSGICIFEGYIEYKRLLGCFLAETKENMMTLELARKVWLSSEDDSSHAEIVGQARSLRQRAQKFKASLRYNVENEKQSAFLANVVSLGHFIEDSFIKTSDPKIEQAVIDRVHEWLDPIERDFGSVEGDLRIFGGRAAFELYDTYG
ncbi:MAG TPA: alanine--tRNA ligase-related protein, partial [Verrucomicrobiota bacterium]|nr:alanine--tRNA ligase-related protein [Verrucomicrobiota bacterium]